MKIHSLKVRPSAIGPTEEIKFVLDVSYRKAVAATLTFTIDKEKPLRFVEGGAQTLSIAFQVQLSAGSNLVTTEAVTLVRLPGGDAGASIKLTLEGGPVIVSDAVWIDFEGAEV